MKQWKKYLAAAGGAAAVLALVLIIQHNPDKQDTVVGQNSTMVKESIQAGESSTGTGENSTETEENSTLAAAKTSPPAKENAGKENQSASEEDIKSEVDELMNTYYKSGKADKDNSNSTETQSQEMKKTESGTPTDEIIEEYRDIKNYIKPGLDEDSYIVFTTYNIKVFNIDTLVPGMSSLFVVRDENGQLTIKDDPDNKKLNEHIQKLSKEKDIKKIIDNVNSKLAAAIKKDNSLKEFIDYLK